MNLCHAIENRRLRLFGTVPSSPPDPREFQGVCAGVTEPEESRGIYGNRLKVVSKQSAAGGGDGALAMEPTLAIRRNNAILVHGQPWFSCNIISLILN
jgi:hypothetical protein